MVHIFKVELVATRVKHVNHFVNQYSLNHSLTSGHILADYNLNAKLE